MYKDILILVKNIKKTLLKFKMAAEFKMEAKTKFFLVY
jgi:hypothetical protein